MKHGIMKFNATRAFLFLNEKNEVITRCNATRNETMESARQLVNESDNIASVMLIELSTNNEVGFYKK